RGKLAVQDQGEKSDAKLLRLIRSEKPRYIAEQGLPKQRGLSEPAYTSLFDIPGNWEWTRLGDIAAYIQRGKSPNYSEGSGVFVVSQRCVQWSGLNLSAAKEISKASLESYEPFRFLKPGDLL